MSAIPTETRDRVIAAAAELYEQADRQRFPTVDAVRRFSRADMNTVSVVMKDWRQAQTKQIVTVAVPEAIQQANAAAVAALWVNATELANQSLRSAQAGWEKERAELDEMRAELAAGYETQAAEFEAAKKQLTDSEAKTAEQAQQLAAVCQSEAEATNRAERAEARAAAAEAERDAARKEASTAREEAAKLTGKLEATQTQATSLMQALAVRQPVPETLAKPAAKAAKKQT